MGIRFQNKGITEASAPSTVTCVMNGSCTAGVPVAHYLSSSGVVTGIVAAVASNAVNWGLASEAAATGTVTNIIVGGQANLKVLTHTAGQVILAIDTAGSATTAAASATNTSMALGVIKSSGVAILY